MKLILAAASQLFEENPATRIAETLGCLARREGHDVDVFRIPFRLEDEQNLEAMFGIRLMDLTGCGDALLTVGAPACLLRHHNKTCVLPEGFQLPGKPAGAALRAALLQGLREARAVFSPSQMEADLISRESGVSCAVLPAAPAEQFDCLLRSALP